MATKSLGTLTIDLITKTGGFEQGMDRAARTAKSRSDQIDAAVDKVRIGVLGIGAAAATMAVTWAKNMADAGREITTLSSLAGTSVENFQRMAYGAQTVGIEQQKLADILKDTQDKIGEFLNVGGGPLQDFFKEIAPRVGLTAKSFQNLSGDQALGLYVSALDKAGLSQAEMTFYMEALASDSTALLPLLRNNATEMKSLGDEAERFGVVMSKDTVAAAQQLDRNLQQLSAIVRGVSVSFANQVLPVFSQFITNAIEASEQTESLKREVDKLSKDKSLPEWIDIVGRGVAITADVVIALAKAAVVAGKSFKAVAADAKVAVNAIPGVWIYNKLFGDKSALETAAREREEIVGDFNESLSDLWNYQGDANLQAWLKAVDQINKAAETGRASIDGLAGGGSGRGGADRKKEVTELQRLLKQLEVQQATLGMTADAAERYRIEIAKGSDADRKKALALFDQVKAYEASVESAEQYRKLIESLQTPEEKATALLVERLKVLDQAKVSTEEYAETVRRISEAAFEAAPKSEGVQQQLPGIFGDFSKIDEDQKELEEWYVKQLELLEDFRQQRADLNAEWDARELEIQQQYETEAQRIQDAREQVRMASTEAMFGNLSDMAKTFFGEQSGVYKALFALEKSYAIAKILMNAPKTASDAYQALAGIPVVGPALGAAAAAAALAFQLAQVAGVRGVNLSGMAHDGIDSVPETGTWLLEKGERVMTSETSARLDAALSRIERRGAGAPIINLIEDRDRAGQVYTETNADGETVINLVVADIRGGGKVYQAMRGTFGLQRVGT